jgi:uncharacterized protein
MALLKVKITPASSNNAFLSWRGDELKISLQAAPEKGKANQALVKFLAKALGLSPQAISIVQGHTQANKVLEIELSEAKLFGRLPEKI